MKLIPVIAAIWLAAPSWALNIPTPERAEVTFSASEPVNDYEVPGGPVQQAGGELRIENPQVLSGDRLRKTFELPSRTDLDQAFDDLRPTQGAVIFECSGRECGRSNLWANDLYQIRTLYGRDRDQRYRLVRQGDTWQSLYLVQRGNRRVYAHFEQIVERQEQVQPGRAYSLDAQFSAQQRLSQTPSLQALRQAMLDHPSWSFRILVRVPGVQDLAQLQLISQQRANALRQWLEARESISR